MKIITGGGKVTAHATKHKETTVRHPCNNAEANAF